MFLQKQTRFMLAFLAPENPLWKPFLRPGNQNSGKAILQVTDVLSSTFSTWRSGGKISPARANMLFDMLLSKIARGDIVRDASKRAEMASTINSFRQAYFENATTTYDIAKILAMSVEDCQQVVDEAIYDQYPLLTTVYRDASTEDDLAKADLKKYRGVYEMYVQRHEQWFKAPLQVRYRMKIRDGLILRCKLNAPVTNQSEGREYWEYDGVVAVETGRRLFWMFEKRDADVRDYFFFITGTGHQFENRFTMSGQYLTTRQDRLQTVVSGGLFIQRYDQPGEEETETIMYNSSSMITDKSQCDDLDRRLVASEKAAL